MQNKTGVIFPRVGYLNITREELDSWQTESALQPQESTYFFPMKSPPVLLVLLLMLPVSPLHLTLDCRTSRKVPKEIHLLLKHTRMRGLMMSSITVCCYY